MTPDDQPRVRTSQVVHLKYAARCHDPFSCGRITWNLHKSTPSESSLNAAMSYSSSSLVAAAPLQFPDVKPAHTHTKQCRCQLQGYFFRHTCSAKRNCVF